MSCAVVCKFVKLAQVLKCCVFYVRLCDCVFVVLHLSCVSIGLVKTHKRSTNVVR